MKIMRDVVGKNAPPRTLLCTDSPQCHSAVVGHHRSNTLQENISIARQLTTLRSKFDRYSAGMSTCTKTGASLPHALCWARIIRKEHIWIAGL